MEKVYRFVTRRIKIGWMFSCIHNGSIYKIEVDNGGNVTMASYSNDKYSCLRRKGNPDFDETMRIAMKAIMLYDKDEFIEMRDNYLNERYRSIAEKIRIQAMLRYDF